jgi:hypothetical protein
VRNIIRRSDGKGPHYIGPLPVVQRVYAIERFN